MASVISYQCSLYSQKETYEAALFQLVRALSVLSGVFRALWGVFLMVKQIHCVSSICQSCLCLFCKQLLFCGVCGLCKIQQLHINNCCWILRHQLLRVVSSCGCVAK